MSDARGPGDAAADGEGGGHIGSALGPGLLNPSLAHHIANTLGWADLRPLQSEAIGPLLAGEDALLLAPTAGGKTEAAVFPLLSRMTAEGWGAPSLHLPGAAEGVAEQPAAPAGDLRRVGRAAGSAVARGRDVRGARAAAARSAGRAADHAGVAGVDAGQRQR